MDVITTILESAGLAAIVAAAAVVDWRLGLVVLGAALLAVSWALARRGGRRR